MQSVPDAERRVSKEGYVMSKYRVKYQRREDARFISHLDLMRTMNRAMKRAGAPLKYTEGFNPHVVMTVALPLSVGITSEC